jgi:DNA-binding transcriptional LysR family regulator
VPRHSKLRSSAELWRQRRIAERLIALPATDSASKQFLESLRRRGVEWPISLEASSMEAIANYVANGEGIGLSVPVPALAKLSGVRILPLEGFAPLKVGIYWHGPLTPLLRTFLAEAQSHVRQQYPEWACADAAPVAPATPRPKGDAAASASLPSAPGCKVSPPLSP